MTESEYVLIQSLRNAVKNNPSLFSEAVLMMQAGVDEAINDYKIQAMNMEKLAMAYGCSATMRHTKSTKDWIENLMQFVEKDSKFFNHDFSKKLKVTK